MIKNMVSVIVPVYNIEKYLEECVKSIMNQSYKNIEIILVDDGSTDKSGILCDEFGKLDKRIKVVHKENGGAASAKNIGLDEANGEYICFVDGDDYIFKDFIEILYNQLIKYNADISECSFYYLYKSHIEKDSFKSNNVIFTSQDYLNQYVDEWQSSLFWNKLFKISVIGDIRFKQERRCIDDEFFTYKVILNATLITRSSNNKYYYRQRKSSAVQNSQNSIQKAKDALDILVERYKLVTVKFPRLKKKYIEHDINNLYYISTVFDLNDELVSLFKKNVYFYFKESILNKCNIRIIYNISRLLFLKNKKVLCMSVKTDDYFE